MLNDSGAKVVRLIDEDRAAKVARITAGSCSPEEYKYLCGEIHGLDLAKDHLLAVLKKEEDDE